MMFHPQLAFSPAQSLNRQRRFAFRLLVFASLIAVSVPSRAWASDEFGFKADIEPILRKHCTACHGADAQEGNLRIDHLDLDLINGDNADRWHEVLNRINVGEMPPEDEPRLSPEELRTITGWLTAELKKAAIARRTNGGRIVLRRLNRREYGNTLRDLFHVPLQFEKPLPPDGPSPDGFLNNGETLAMSPLHFDYYLKIARSAVDKAIPSGPKPTAKAYRFDLSLGSPPSVDKKGKKKSATLKLDASYLGAAEKQRGNPPVSVSFGRRADRGNADEHGALLAPGLRARGTGIPGRQVPNPSVVFRFREFPSEGPVRIRVTAGAVDVEDPVQPQVRVFIGTLLDDGTEFAFLGPGQRVTHSADEPGVYEFFGQLEELPLPFRSRDSSNRGDLNFMMVGVVNSVDAEVDSEKTPVLRVSRVDFEAPFHESWPPVASEEIFFDGAAKEYHEVEYAREIFERFMTRAFRRPVSDTEVDRIHAAWKQVWLEDVVQPREAASAEQDDEPDPGKPGLQVLHFDSAPSDAANETLATMKSDANGIVDAVSLKIPQRVKNDKFALQFSGVLNVPHDGLWTLRLASDDGSRLYVDNKLLINHDGDHGMDERSAEAELSAGPHAITVNYYNSRGGSGLRLEWEGPGVERSEIDAKYFTHGGSLPEPKPVLPTFESTIKEFLPVILASPNFLYLAEPAAANKQLTGYELASRLSYFLWSTLPDRQLLDLASRGELSKPHVLRQQVTRMLEDDRSDEFIRNFVDQWLDLDGVQRVAINKDRHKDFWDETKAAMQNETRAFFAEVLRHDLNALNLIDSDFTMLNDHLAEHYRITNVTGPEFRRVALKPDDRRGGLLTHGSVLYGGSDGKDSHPIRRGVWLLRKLLDDPPPDPPPNVPDLDQTDPKLTGLPLKKQLEAHRDNAACANCHQQIDPWGIAFEEYSAVGRWRGTKGDRDFVADAATSTLQDGTTIGSLQDLKSYLLDHRQEDFARALTKNLLIYALGRSLDFSDEEFVAELSAGFRENEFRIRWLIEGIVLSEAFRRR